MGTTAEKINYAINATNDIAEGINNIGGNITQNTELADFREELDKIYNELPKVTGTGTEITLNNTKKGRIDIGLKGNTSQESTTGKNLYYGTSDSYSFTAPSKTWYFINGSSGAHGSSIGTKTLYKAKVEQGKTYLLKGIVANIITAQIVYSNENIIQILGADGFSAEILASGVTFTANRDDDVILRLQCAANSNVTVSEIQLEEGTTATDYEPYTGGVPSPNPDYPQAIKVVTGNNNVNIKGKNLWGGFANDYTSSPTGITFITYKDGSIYANGTATSGSPSSITVANAISNGFIKTLPAGTYTVSPGGDNYRIQVLDSSANLITTVAENETSQTFTLTEETIAIIRLNLLSGRTIDRTVKIQLEEGSTASPYEPYITPQNKSLNLGTLELCKIGDYQDYIYKSNDKWYKKALNGSVLLNGSEENWRADNNNTLYGINLSNCKLNTATSSSQGLCDKFIVSGLTQTRNFQQYFAIYGGSTETVSVWFNKRNKTLEEWKAWVSNNNLKVYHQLENPTDIEITDTTLINQLEALNRTIIPGGTIVIETESEEENAQLIVKASALKDWTKEIEVV